MARGANLLEKVLGHGNNAVTEQNMTNPARNREKYADPSGETMKALVWMGKNTVEVGQSLADLCTIHGCSTDLFLRQLTSLNLEPSKTAMLSLRLLDQRSAVPIYICTMALSLKCKKETY